MRDFGYSERARRVQEARAEIDRAYEDVTSRNNEADPKTRRWLDAIASFRVALSRAYPEALQRVDQGESRAEDLDTADMLDFLEADPVFFGSGYMKEKLLTVLKRRSLDRHEVARLQAIIISVVRKSDRRREFLHYCRVAMSVDDQPFRDELRSLEGAEDPAIGLRANWVLAALCGKWPELRRTSRTSWRRNRQAKLIPR